MTISFIKVFLIYLYRLYYMGFLLLYCFTLFVITNNICFLLYIILKIVFTVNVTKIDIITLENLHLLLELMQETLYYTDELKNKFYKQD